ncbi:MAG: WecB/TagA/CpsF family glycosyltransferase, partial [Pseudomonadota bacterium]
TVATINLDHVMKLRHDPMFRRIYNDMDLITPDGMPFVWLSRQEGTPLPGRITGSDLLFELARSAAETGQKLFLFGSTHERLHGAAKALKTEFPRLRFAGAYAPPFGFERDAAIHEEVTQILRTVRPDIILVALGAPRQEIFSAAMAERVRHGVFIGVGGGLDFLSGVRRAPGFMQRAGLEWLWRAVTEPVRLGPRFLNIILHLPVLFRAHKRDRAEHEAAVEREAALADGAAQELPAAAGEDAPPRG